jgi:uncharacterized hydrophobic protein (TIGR00271 family)
MGIATLGLAMGSSAVVIGAMLISPLMSPLIELGAGLATGSLLLSIRAGVRTVGSVVVVVLGAAGITRLLPFHEITAELAARTSPTMLDLFVAVFCALAAVYTTVRQSKDVMSAAAGTAIGISLVPPLCTGGYGLGISNPDVLSGGLLLFTANFAAIIAVATLSILLLGFGQVHVETIEGDLLASEMSQRVTHRAARLTRRVVGKRLGVLRLLIPAVLVGAILVPLKRALEEVSWQVRVRAKVEDALAAIPGAVVRQSLEIRGGVVRVRLFLVGRPGDAEAIAMELRTRITVISGTTPIVEVFAVPDAESLEAMAAQLQTAVTARTTVTPVVAAPVDTVAPFLTALREAEARYWPAAAGELLRLRAGEGGGGKILEVEVTHLGAPLGEAGEQVLERAWTEELEITVEVRDRAVPPAAVRAAAGDGLSWLTEALHILELADGVDLQVCLTVPAAPPAARPPRRARPTPDEVVGARIDAAVRTIVEARAQARPGTQLTPGTEWRIQVQRTPCHDAAPAVDDVAP